MKHIALALATMIVLIAGSLAIAQEQPAEATPARAADDKAIRDAAQAFSRAFEKGDASAVAAMWTEEAEYIDESGETIRGRAELEKTYEAFFAQRQKVTVETQTDSVRFLGKDTAVEDGTFTVNAEGVPASSSSYSALYVRQDGHWLIALLKEKPDDSAAQANLDDLVWLVGTWESEGEAAKASITYQWDETKRFLRAHFTIQPKEAGEEPRTGTEMIGIEPGLGLLRGWTFDSDGAIGESVWMWDGERWVIEALGTQPDGSQTAATNLLTRSDKDSFTWRSVKRSVDGEDLPDIPQVTVKRVPDKSLTSRD